MAIKFFDKFSLEKEILKIAATSDNFHKWEETNKAGYNDFIKQIQSSIKGVEDIPSTEVLDNKSLNDYLSKIDVFKDPNIREKVIKAILKGFKSKIKEKEEVKKPEDPNRPFDFTYFTETNIKNGVMWVYGDIHIVRPSTRDMFFELDEANMPLNMQKRRKYNYTDFYTEEKFDRYKRFGIAFYFFSYKENYSILFMVIPQEIRMALVPPINIIVPLYMILNFKIICIL